MEGLMELAAIWIDKAIKVEEEDGKIIPTVRLCKGQHIRCENGFVSHVTEQYPANATIVRCRGDLYNTILLLDIVNNNFEVEIRVVKDERNIFPKR